MKKMFLLLASFIHYTAISHCMLRKGTFAFALRAAFPADNFDHIVISPDNRHIAITCIDQFEGATKIFNIPQQTEEATINDCQYVEDCKFSADNKHLLLYTSKDILHVWDIQAQRIIRTHQSGIDSFISEAVIFDEGHWAVGHGSPYIHTPDPIHVIYDTAINGVISTKLDNTTSSAIPAYNPDGSAIAYQSSATEITMIKIPSNHRLGNLELDTRHTSSIIRWSKNGKWIAAVCFPISKDGVNIEDKQLDLYLWDATNHTLLYRKKSVGHALDFSGDSEVLFYQVDRDQVKHGKLQAYNITTKSVMTFEDIHTKTIGCQNNLIACAALIEGKKMVAVYEKITLP